MKSTDDTWQTDLRRALQRHAIEGVQRSLTCIAEREGPYVIVDEQRLLNLASNDYLGLATDSLFRDPFYAVCTDTDAVDHFGSSSSSSRLLAGSTKLVDACENSLADLYGREAALLFSSGYHANLGVITSLAGRDDVVFSDKQNHASIIDGILLSRATMHRYRHADYTHLRELLAAHRGEGRHAVIISESLFSMDGDFADLAALVALKKEFDAILIIDEAHAVGAIGHHGCGLAEVAGLIQDIDVIIGTGGKALAAMGAFVVSDALVRETLVNSARSFIFTTAPPPVMIAWLWYVIRHLGDTGERRRALADRAHFLRDGLRDAGCEVRGSAHIVPVMAGTNRDAVALAETLRQHGFFAPAIRPPTVPDGAARVRLSLSASLSRDDIADIPRIVASVPHAH